MRPAHQGGNPSGIDEIAVWNSELTGADVSNQFAAVSSGTKKPTVRLRELLITAVRMAADGSGMELEFNADPSETYTIEWAEDAGAGYITADTVNGTSTNMTWVDDGDTSQRRSSPVSEAPFRVYRYRSAP